MFASARLREKRLRTTNATPQVNQICRTTETERRPIGQRIPGPTSGASSLGAVRFLRCRSFRFRHLTLRRFNVTAPHCTTGSPIRCLRASASSTVKYLDEENGIQKCKHRRRTASQFVAGSSSKPADQIPGEDRFQLETWRRRPRRVPSPLRPPARAPRSWAAP